MIPSFFLKLLFAAEKIRILNQPTGYISERIKSISAMEEQSSRNVRHLLCRRIGFMGPNSFNEHSCQLDGVARRILFNDDA